MQEPAITDYHSSPHDLMPFRAGLMEHVLNPLNSLAAESGGLVEVDPEKVGSDLDKLSRRVIIAYQVKRARDDKPRRIAVRALRRGLHVEATRWSSLASGEAVTAARAISLAGGRDEPGDLPVTCSVQTSAAGAESLALPISLSPLHA